MTLALLSFLGRAWQNSCLAAILRYVAKLLRHSVVWRALFGSAADGVHDASLLDRVIVKGTNLLEGIVRPFSKLYHNCQKSSAVGLLGDYIEETAVFSALSCGFVMCVKKGLLGGLSVKWLAVAFAVLAVYGTAAFYMSRSAWVDSSWLMRQVKIYLPLKFHKRVLVLSTLLGAALGLMNLFIPMEDVLKTYVVIMGVILVVRRPFWGFAASLAGIAFLPTVSETLLILFTAALAFLQQPENPLKGKMKNYRLPMLIFVLSVLLSGTVFTLTRMESLRSLLLWGTALLLWPAGTRLVKGEKEVRDLMRAAVFAGALISFYGLYQGLIGVEVAGSWVDDEVFGSLTTRIFTTFENPNVYGEYLVLMIPFAVGLFFYEKKPMAKLVAMAGGGLMFINLLLTYSRGAWLGIFCAAALYCYLKDKRLTGLLIVALCVVLCFAPASILDRLASVTNLSESSNSYRFDIWAGFLDMERDFWYQGTGLGMQSAQLLYPNYMSINTPAVHSHNLFLQMGVEIGAVGLVGFLLLARNVFKNSIRALKTEPKGSVCNCFLPAALAGMLGHFVHGMVDYTWYYPKIMMLFWLTVTLAVILQKGRASQYDKCAACDHGHECGRCGQVSCESAQIQRP